MFYQTELKQFVLQKVFTGEITADGVKQTAQKLGMLLLHVLPVLEAADGLSHLTRKLSKEAEML